MADHRGFHAELHPLPDGEDDNRACLRGMKRMRRVLLKMVDPFCLPKKQFKKFFRLTKDLVRQLVEELTPYIYYSGHGNALTVKTKVLVALQFYATGSYQAAIGERWVNCVGRSTVADCIEEVTNALNQRRIQMKWIKFPRTKQERDRNIRKHSVRYKIPGVVGFIDGTEVSIFPPYKEVNPQAFWTRKHQYALNTQIICDSDLNIMNIVASYPGSCNDKFIFGASAARRRMKDAFHEEPCWLLGDSGYNLEPWLIIPDLEAEEGSPGEFFTKMHCKARNCVERCIGVLKARFRCLLRDRLLHYSPQKAGRIIKACAVLHNMCRSAGLPNPEPVEGAEDIIPWVPMPGEDDNEDEDEDPHDPALVVNPREGNVLQVGREIRQRLIDFLFMNREAEDIGEDVQGPIEELDNYDSGSENEQEYVLMI